MADTKPPKVFISYAWEDDLKTWMLDFAIRLRSDGINAILDQWETVPGDQLPEFMEKSVRESDFVLFVCTPTYKRKSDRRKGGVGYEGHIITGEVFQKNNHRKFIPVLRKGKWTSAAPSWAASKLYIDFRGDPYSEASYQQLLNTLFGKSPTAPPLRDDAPRGKIEHEAAEWAERERLEREAEEKAARDKAEKEAKQISAKEKARIKKEEIEKRRLPYYETLVPRNSVTQQESENLASITKEPGENTSLHESSLSPKIPESVEQLSYKKSKNIRLIKTEYIVAIIGAAATIIAGILGSPFIEKLLSPVPVVTELVTATFSSTTQPIQASGTHTLTSTPESTFTITPIPLPTEITDAKGVSMILVPAGEFIMGSDSGEPDERPAHEVFLRDYYIDKYEVTNALYKTCVDAGKCIQPIKSNLENIPRYYESDIYKNYPVVHVTWEMALTYCEWRGASLPTEAEWEKSARGPDGMIFPWGNEFDGLKANFCDFSCDALKRNVNFNDGYVYTSPVGSYPDGNSLYGVLDLAGNVWEWVAGEYRDYYVFSPQDFYLVNLAYATEPPVEDTKHIARGGSWFNSENLLRSSYRAEFDIDYESTASMGFRCAKNVLP